MKACESHFFCSCFTLCPGCCWYFLHFQKDYFKKKDHFVPAWRTGQLLSPGSYFWGDAPQKDACVSLGKTPSCGVSASNEGLLCT